MSKIQKLIEKENKVQDEILEKLDKLERCGCECSCDSRDRGTYSYIFWGEFPEILTVCTECGGVVY